MDVNDLPLDAFCQELANEIDALTCQPAPLNNVEWMTEGGAKVLWPFSDMPFSEWEKRPLEDIRSALRLKSCSRQARLQRAQTMLVSRDLTNNNGPIAGDST